MIAETVPTWLQPAPETPLEVFKQLGWFLVPLPEKSKAPAHPAWNLIDNCSVPDNWRGNVGLALAYSGIVSIDIDHWLKALQWLNRQGIGLERLYNEPQAIVLESGKKGHGKIFYQLPDGVQALPTQQIKIDGECILEFRCATQDGKTVQDVIHGIHPETGKAYRWRIPEGFDLLTYLQQMKPLPDALLQLWQSRLSAEEPKQLEHNDADISWKEIEAALECISPDCSRDEWIKVGMALHLAGSVDGKIDYAFNTWNTWSKKSLAKYPSIREMQKQWNSFKVDKSSSVTLGTLFQIAMDNGYQRPLDASYLFSAQDKPRRKAGIGLDAFVLNGFAGKMEAQMIEDKFVLGRMAILGQSTLFYAKPNAGKTLLTLWLLIDAIKRNEINGSDVYYVNADDTYKGLVFKLKLAEKNGFMMLSPGHLEFKADHLPLYLDRLINEGAARGKILILDTVKKFTDLMNKEKASRFGECVRQFVSHGGTVIMLAHVNKHRGDDNEVIYTGTSDMVDDADCAYTLDTINENNLNNLRTVKFKNFKSRGDVTREAVYRYDYADCTPYHQRLESVVEIGKEERERVEKQKRLDAILDANRLAVEAIKDCVREGITQKTTLINEAHERSGLSKKQITKALADHVGNIVFENQFWQFSIQDKNSHVYQLNEGV